MLGRQRRSLSKLLLPARRISANSVSRRGIDQHSTHWRSLCESDFFLSLISIDYASDVRNEPFPDGEDLGQSQRMRMLGPARSAVCRRGDDFYNPHVQVSGGRERHLLPQFIVNLLRNLQSPPAHGDLCATAQKKRGYHATIRIPMSSVP
jgi:hypothetical protein